jgi:cysteinyl-tRNA synthetase
MLNLYNTLARKKEEFKSINPGKVSMYVCGPTVYDHCHLGHGRGYVAMDIIRRYLEYCGYEVRYIMNYTDVGHLVHNSETGEDPIERKAALEKIDPIAIANKYIESCEEDFAALNIKPATYNPRPTNYIAQIIKFNQELIEKGFAYEVNGSVYFSVEKFPAYGKLSGRNIEDMLIGARVEINLEKKNPLDFALWISAPTEHILKWESPWGVGYPGWHVECSVMSCDLLGQDTFDIHGGGNENIFPHNENEIAQSEAYLGKKMANFWTLWSMVNVDGVKASKSLGNAVSIKDALRKYDAATLRLWIVSSHYRSVMNYSEDAIMQAKTNLQKINDFIFNMEALSTAQDSNSNFNITSYQEKFEAAMDDDLNTPLALSVLYGLITDANKLLAESSLGATDAKKILAFWKKINSVLALVLHGQVEIPQEILELVKKRETARIQKDFSTSDKIRDEIDKLGYTIEDIKDNNFIIKPARNAMHSVAGGKK